MFFLWIISNSKNYFHKCRKHMIKKFASKLQKNTNKNTTFYKQIAHIICSLYKIKEINRKIVYRDDELKTLVLSSEIGRQAIADLKKLKVTRETLFDYDLFYFDSVLGDQFPET